jgi:hypothetical protein
MPPRPPSSTTTHLHQTTGCLTAPNAVSRRPAAGHYDRCLVPDSARPARPPMRHQHHQPDLLRPGFLLGMMSPAHPPLPRHLWPAPFVTPTPQCHHRPVPILHNVGASSSLCHCLGTLPPPRHPCAGQPPCAGSTTSLASPVSAQATGSTSSACSSPPPPYCTDDHSAQVD